MILEYLKNMLQLILSPERGWEDVSASGADSNVLFRKAFMPLLGVAALTVLVRLFYYGQQSVFTLIEIAIAMFGAYMVAYYVARVVLNHYLRMIVTGEISVSRISSFVTYGLGLLVVIEIIDNLIPAELTLVKFLPLFVALILYKGAKFMAVRDDCEMRFFVIIVIAIIIVPLAIFYALKSLIA